MSTETPDWRLLFEQTSAQVMVEAKEVVEKSFRDVQPRFLSQTKEIIDAYDKASSARIQVVETKVSAQQQDLAELQKEVLENRPPRPTRAIKTLLRCSASWTILLAKGVPW